MQIEPVQTVFSPLKITLDVETEQELELLLAFLYLDVFDEGRSPGQGEILSAIGSNFHILRSIAKLNEVVGNDTALLYAGRGDF